MAKFYFQIGLSTALVGFCLYQIDKGSLDPMYWSTIAGIVGYWLPSPQESK